MENRMTNVTIEEVIKTVESNVKDLLGCMEDTAEEDIRQVLEDYIRINSMENILLQTMLDLDKPTQH
tara:strand:+ start:341 stop:541 length:201 start_codon:yes stop_codon:yes gene_type:complete